MNKRKVISIILKSLLIISCILGLLLVIFKVNGFMGGPVLLLYLTIQSNLWISITSIFGIIYIIKNKNSNIYHYLKLAFTISITLTGCVFCIMLAPTVKGAWELPQVLLHVVVPLLSIIDFFIYDSNVYNHTYKNVLYCCIPPIYYLIFATIGYICNWNFGMGTNYPYFFLNYGSDAKIFGFSDKLPYIGSFYWIIILGIFVIGMSYLYIFISRKINKRTN